MKWMPIAHGAWRRMKHPAAWGAILGFEVVWVAARLLSGVAQDQIGAWDFFVPGLFMLGHVVLAPVSWQWTGDDRSEAGLGRGLVQSMLWNGLWVLSGVLLVQDVVKPGRPASWIPPQVDASRREPPPPDPDQAPSPPRRPREDGARPRPPRPDRDRPRPPREDRQAPPPGFRQEVKLLFLNLPFALVLGWFLAGKERAESSEALLKEQEREARLLALQAQLHPHALYNILAGLTELVHEDPDAAEEALVGLVALLRSLTQHGQALQVPLSEERALVRRFLALESIRLGERLEIQWVWPAWADTCLVPPLLLQPLVENAVKHGVAPCPAGGCVRIEVRREAADLCLSVHNTGMPWVAGREGTGLQNMRQRLALMGEDQAGLQVASTETGTLAEVRLRANLAP